jgi:hypothetical protein
MLPWDWTINHDRGPRGHDVPANFAPNSYGVPAGNDAAGYLPQNGDVLPECVQVVVNDFVRSNGDLTASARLGGHGRGWLREHQHKRGKNGQYEDERVELAQQH